MIQLVDIVEKKGKRGYEKRKWDKTLCQKSVVTDHRQHTLLALVRARIVQRTNCSKGFWHSVLIVVRESTVY